MNCGKKKIKMIELSSLNSVKCVEEKWLPHSLQIIYLFS